MADLREIYAACPMVKQAVKGDPEMAEEWTSLIASLYPDACNPQCWDTQSKADGSPSGAQLALFHGHAAPDFVDHLAGEKDVILLSDPRATADLAARLADPTGLQTDLVAAGVVAEHFVANAEPTLMDAINATWRTIYGKRVADVRPMAVREIPRGSATDNFTGNDGDPIDGRALSGGTYTWEKLTGYEKANIYQNTMRADLGSGYFTLNPAVNWQDCYVKALLYTNGGLTSSVTLYARRLDSANYFYPDRRVNTVSLYKRIANVDTSLGSYATGDANPWTAKLQCVVIDPGVLTVYVNGILRIGPVAGDDARDSGNAGAGVRYASPNYGRLDNFEAAEGATYTIPLIHILEAAA